MKNLFLPRFITPSFIVTSTVNMDSDSEHSSEGYSEEPQFTVEEFNSIQQERTEDEPSSSTRAGDWCQCGKCSPSLDMRFVECVCCRDFQDPSVGQNLQTLLAECDPAFTVTGPYQCITNHPAFPTICLYRRNLQHEIHRYSKEFCFRRQNANDNRLLRYISYREFVRWVHGKLGRHIRKVIPACVVKAIRTAFPKLDQETYEGFHYSDTFNPDD